ncbi:baseplate J/gp47 family protein [Paenibacillus qinlingensis]|uniref:baseplate J/gp47 family protein n=1 Tax=Paenibacillus qinlingensis TaxID=1837343 RepID=UPI001564D4B3|nr:baseplate J/gp47 family protein [Paenibacillus qinlingensis]NQX60444.1 baseplate J/gp47 family protein [Paenibacillus qinlingensis]
MASLPDYLVEQTEEAIRSRMLSSLPSDLDKSEGSYVWDAVAPASIELALAALQAQEVLRRGFAGTTFGSYLDLRCAERGVTRKEAMKAVGQVKFTGVVGTVVPQGTRVGTLADTLLGTSSMMFETLAAAVVDSSGYVMVSVSAVEGGSKGNVPSGAISLLITPIAGIMSVTNTAPMTGGAEVEKDDALLNRYYAKVRSPGTSGNKADYLNWALDVAGVGAAQVVPLWQGPGTVKVVIIGTDKRSVAAPIVTAAQQYIYPAPPLVGKAPIGAVVSVVAAAEVAIGVQAVLTLNGSRTLTQVKNDFTGAVRAYLSELAFSSDPAVRYVRIGSLLLDTPGVQDYANLLINGGSSNIAINVGQVAVVGTVSLV